MITKSSGITKVIIKCSKKLLNNDIFKGITEKINLSGINSNVKSKLLRNYLTFYQGNVCHYFQSLLQSDDSCEVIRLT